MAHIITTFDYSSIRKTSVFSVVILHAIVRSKATSACGTSMFFILIMVSLVVLLQFSLELEFIAATKSATHDQFRMLFPNVDIPLLLGFESFVALSNPAENLSIFTMVSFKISFIVIQPGVTSITTLYGALEFVSLFMHSL